MKRIVCCLFVLSSLSWGGSDNDDDDDVWSDEGNPCKAVVADCPICFLTESQLPSASDLRVVCPCAKNICVHCLQKMIDRMSVSAKEIACPYCRFCLSIEQLIAQCELRPRIFPMTIEGVQQLKANQLHLLRQDQIKQLTNLQIRAFLPEQVRELTLVQMTYFTQKQMGYFTLPQLAAFTSEQLRALTPEQIRGFLVHQFETLKTRGFTIINLPLSSLKKEKTCCCCCW